jgi:hypothetical protein
MIQPNPNQIVNIEVTAQGVETVLQALGTLPFNQVADLFISIRQQAVSQLQDQPEMTAAEETPAGTQVQ